MHVAGFSVLWLWQNKTDRNMYYVDVKNAVRAVVVVFVGQRRELPVKTWLSTHKTDNGALRIFCNDAVFGCAIIIVNFYEKSVTPIMGGKIYYLTDFFPLKKKLGIIYHVDRALKTQPRFFFFM